MKKKTALKPISAAIGATFVVSMATIPIANAADNPFGLNELSGSYLLAEAESGVMTTDEVEVKAGGEGKCAEGKCAEGKCSGGAKEGPAAAAEGKCGEGKCAEGKCSGGAKEGPPKE